MLNLLKIKYINFFSYIILIACPTLVLARPATLQDADIKIEKYNETIEIKSDGTSVQIIEITLRALKESGKDKLISYPLVYNKGSSDVQILEAKTLQADKEFPVDLNLLEDKPLASTIKGFDQNNQILVVYPNLEINSAIYLKYRTIVKEPVLKNYYDARFTFGADTYWEHANVAIVSALPLNVDIHDTTNVLEVNQKNVNNLHHININLKTPTINVPIDEVASSYNPNNFPSVSISSLKEWQAFGNQFSIFYEEILNAPLPEFLQKIANEAQKIENLHEKINLVTTRLAEQITYMGDWRTVKGGVVPRPLKIVAETRYGDCKDFSANTVAVLRKLGIDAYPAFVLRGEGAYDLSTTYPLVPTFNHAIVYVQLKDKNLWIDPTNFTSFAGSIYPDIEDKISLVLKKSDAFLRKIPLSSPRDNGYSLRRNITLQKNDETFVTGSANLYGSEALWFTGEDLKASKEATNLAIIRMIADESRITDWKVNPYDLSHRTVKPLQFEFSFNEKHNQVRTTSGKAYWLPANSMTNKILIQTKNRLSDLYLGNPMTTHSETILKNTTKIGKLFTACKVDSPWLMASRGITDTAEGINIMLDVTIKKNRILNSELQSKEYLNFQNKIYNCFGDIALLYTENKN